MEIGLQRSMLEHQQNHFDDLHSGGSFGEKTASSEHLQKPSSSPSNGSGSNGNVDSVLLKDLAEIVPLVESLMDRKPKTSFTRRSSLICTKTPSKESDHKKVIDSKGRNKAVQSIPPRKPRDCCADKNHHKNACADELPNFKSRSSTVEKDKKQLILLQERVTNLQKELLEKDELLKSAEMSRSHLVTLHAKLEELKVHAAEKDSLIKTADLQISDAKLKLADKQTSLEKLQWEALTSNEKVEKLQNDLDSMQGEVSAFMLLFNELGKNNSTSYAEAYDTSPCDLDPLPHIDDIDENKMQQMEEVRKAYIAALTTAKEKQDEESVLHAAKARLLLQSLVLGTENANLTMEVMV